MTTRIGIFLFDGTEELDAIGPWEVLSAWQHQFGPDIEVFTFAQHDGPVTCAKGLTVVPHHTWETAPPIDILIYPGGQGVRPHLGNPEIKAWLGATVANASLITSVCTGSLVLADNGLLDGRRATTHWGSLEHLAQLGTDIEVDADARFVDTGDIITAAGVSAGIDMALHLIIRLADEDTARQVKRYIQYDPQPPV